MYCHGQSISVQAPSPVLIHVLHVHGGSSRIFLQPDVSCKSSKCYFSLFTINKERSSLSLWNSDAAKPSESHLKYLSPTFRVSLLQYCERPPSQDSDPRRRVTWSYPRSRLCRAAACIRGRRCTCRFRSGSCRSCLCWRSRPTGLRTRCGLEDKRQVGREREVLAACVTANTHQQRDAGPALAALFGAGVETVTWRNSERFFFCVAAAHLPAPSRKQPLQRLHFPDCMEFTGDTDHLSTSHRLRRYVT